MFFDANKELPKKIYNIYMFVLTIHNYCFVLNPLAVSRQRSEGGGTITVNQHESYRYGRSMSYGGGTITLDDNFEVNMYTGLHRGGDRRD